MSREANNLICESCKKESLVEGTLEGVSFQPVSEKSKWLSSGIYGIKAYVCMDCGCISRLSIDTEILKNILKSK